LSISSYLKRPFLNHLDATNLQFQKIVIFFSFMIYDGQMNTPQCVR
jgi:hypothetical protein